MAKKKGKADGAASAEPRVRLSAHPRAKRHIAAAKGWGGIAGFGLVLLLSLQQGATTFAATSHALLAGIGFSMLGWAAAVGVWRQYAVAEVRLARRRAEETAERVAAEAAERAAAAEAA
jgi:hypothetical protein